MSSASVGTASVGAAPVRTTSQPVDTGRYTARYFSLVNDVGGYVCRYILLSKCGNLTEFLNANRQTIYATMRNGHIFTIDEINKLFPYGNAASSSEEFDVSLSLSLLRTFIFNDWLSIAMWKRKLHDIYVTNTTEVADLARIRIYRNMFTHDCPDTSTSMPEEVFWSRWGDLTRIFLHLGKLYNIPDVCRMINDRLNKPLDEARENELDNEIKLLREEVAHSEQIDEITGIVQTIDQNQGDIKGKVDDIHKGMTTIEVIEIQDEVPDDIFEKTEQYNDALNTLKANQILVLDGAPGEGKTTAAKKLVVEVSEGKSVQLMTTGDWKKLDFDKSVVDAILIDDMFGARAFDKEESRKWQKVMPKIAKWVNSCPKNKRYFVMTSRTYILQEAKKKMYLANVFTDKNIFTFSTSKLRTEEKLSILNKHLSNSKQEGDQRPHKALLDEISSLKLTPSGSSCSIGFPECARLFASSERLRNEGVEFFQKPMTHIMTCISDIVKQDEAFIAFFVLWAQSNQTLKQRDLEISLTDTPEEIIDPIKKLQYPSEYYLRQIREQLQYHAFKGGFVNFDRVAEKYRFSHEVVRDAVGLVAYHRNASAALSCCSAAFIENYVRLPSKSAENGTEREERKEVESICLSLPPSRFDQICLRVVSLIIPDPSVVNREYYTLCKHQIFEHEEVCTIFIKETKRKGILESLLTTEVRKISSLLIKYEFLDECEKNIGVRIPSFLLWQTEKVPELAKLCFKEMKQNEDEYKLQNELSVSLFVAAIIGSLEIVQFLVAIGGSVTYKMLMIAYTNGMLEFFKQCIGLSNSETVESLYHFATSKENIDLCDLLLKERVLDGKKRTLFCYAVATGKVKIVENLRSIAQSHKVDMTPNDSQNTPLHVAIRMSVEDPDETRRHVWKTLSVSLCKTCTDNLNLKNSNGRTSLYLACIYNATDIIKELQEKDAHRAEENKTLLHEFVMTDKVEAIKNLLTIGFNDTVTDTEDRTPMQFAVALGKTTAADVLRTFARSRET